MEWLDSNWFRGAVMVLLIVGFLGTWAWAWSSKRKNTFKEASMLPLEEDDGSVPAESKED